jgi:hypothetical protein
MPPLTQPPEAGLVLPVADPDTTALEPNGEDGEDESSVMEAQNALQDFVDTVEFLPADIIRSMGLVRRLDENYRTCTRQLDDLAKGKMLSAGQKSRMAYLLNLATHYRRETVAEAERIKKVLEYHSWMIEEQLKARSEWPVMDSDEEEQARQAILRAREKAEEKKRVAAMKANLKHTMKKEKVRHRPASSPKPLPPGYPRLSEFEMSRLRKKMKKNTAWDPSEKVIRRELILLGRLQPDGTMWPEDVAAAAAAGLQPTMPAPRPPPPPRNTHVQQVARQARSLPTTEVTENRLRPFREKRESVEPQPLLIPPL